MCHKCTVIGAVFLFLSACGGWNLLAVHCVHFLNISCSFTQGKMTMFAQMSNYICVANVPAIVGSCCTSTWRDVDEELMEGLESSN